MPDDGLRPARRLAAAVTAAMPIFTAVLVAIEPTGETVIAAFGASGMALLGLGVVRAFDLDDPARQPVAEISGDVEPAAVWREAA